MTITTQLTHPIIVFLINQKLIELWQVDNYDIWQIIQLYEIGVVNVVNQLQAINNKQRR